MLEDIQDFNIAMKTSVLLWVAATVPIVTETLVSFCLPAIVTVKGEEFQKLTERRQGARITAINSKDLKLISLKYTRICSDHFLSVKSSEQKTKQIRIGS